MRILVVTNLYPDLQRPAFGTFVRSHVAALQRAGADVEVAAIHGVPVHQEFGRKYLKLSANAMSLALRSVVRRRRPHIVEAHIAYPTGVIAWPIARLLGAKLVLYCHGSDVSKAGVRSPVHKRIATELFRRANLLVANSAHTRAVLVDRYGISPRAITIWSPGIDTDIFHPDEMVNRDHKQVLFVGRLDAEKGVHVLIDAIGRLARPRPALRIVGDGPERAALEKQASEQGIAARFEGSLTPAEVARAMAQAGVLVVPSVYQEPLGLVALEGMATGALVIASASGGLQESVSSGQNGWLAIPGDPPSLADAISEALTVLSDQPERARVMRAAALEVADRHNVYAIGGEALRTYADLLERPT